MTIANRSSENPFKPEGFRIPLGSLLLTTLAINIISLALPVLTLQVYDRILPTPGSGTLPVLISGVCLAIVLEAALRLTRSYTLGWSGAAYEHRVSCAAMQRILHADLSKLSQYGIGEHLHRMNAIAKMKDFYNGYAQMTLFELIFVPMFLGLTIYIAGPLAFVPAAVLMLFTMASTMNGQQLRAALKERDETDDDRYNFLIEGLEGVHTLKSFALENTFARRYETLEEASTLSNYNVTEATSKTFNTGSIFSNIMVAAVISVGAILALQGQITTGALIATVLLSGRMMQPIQRALALWAKYQDFTLAKSKIETLFETPQHTTVIANDTAPERLGSLRLENLAFRTHDDGPWVLDGINLDLKRGESILISADRNIGKTALLELISGIYPPTSGTVDIDGQNVLRYTPEQLIGHVGYVQTEGLTFRGTIRENMTCFGQVDEARASEMAAILKVDRDIAKLPSGFDTFLNGNNTDSITPGLKQRIAMVRVLAPKPRIILFDNADRSLDREGYNLVYNFLARLKGKATMILISSDHNICGLADRAYQLENGKLSETSQSQSTGHIQPYRELHL